MSQQPIMNLGIQPQLEANEAAVLTEAGLDPSEYIAVLVPLNIRQASQGEFNSPIGVIRGTILAVEVFIPDTVVALPPAQILNPDGQGAAGTKLQKALTHPLGHTARMIVNLSVVSDEIKRQIKPVEAEVVPDALSRLDLSRFK